MNILRHRKQYAVLLAVLLSSCLVLSDAGFAQAFHPPMPPGCGFPLNQWSLSAPPWSSDFNDEARGYAGLNTAPGWSDNGTCLSVDTNEPAYLNYNIYEPYGWTNVPVNSPNGALSFWYQANYTSMQDGGSGPGNWGSLINIGAYSSNASVGEWLLAIDPSASNIVFLTASKGSRQVVFKYPIDMDEGDWWQICVNWSATNTSLYLNGQLATNCDPITLRPTVEECEEYGFFVGSLGTGANGQAQGQFQNLISFDAPRSAQDIASDYATDSAAVLNSGGTLPVGFMAGGGGFHPADDSPPGFSGDGGGGGGSNSTPELSWTIPTNGLWMWITGITNNTVYVDLNDATDYVYEIFSATNQPGPPWNIETEVFPGTNQQIAPFTVQEAGRSNLFLWARDWTGITNGDNETPEWWCQLSGAG